MAQAPALERFATECVRGTLLSTCGMPGASPKFSLMLRRLARLYRFPRFDGRQDRLSIHPFPLHDVSYGAILYGVSPKFSVFSPLNMHLSGHLYYRTSRRL